MDLMPSTFGCSSESLSQPHRGGCAFPKLQQASLESGSYNRMRLRCNQLDEHFSFQN